MDFRAFARHAEDDQHGEPYIEHGPAEELFEPPACSYCGATEFEPQVDNGRVSRATCSACGGTMVSHGGQWMPDLIGQPDNHPSTKPDPRSGGVPGIGAVPVPRREEDLNSRTAGANGELPTGLEISHRLYQPGDDEHTDLDSHHPGATHGIFLAHLPGDREVGRLEYSAGPEKINVHETRVHSGYRRRGIATELYRQLGATYPEHHRDWGGPLTEDGEKFWYGRTAGADWCRHRRNEHCWLPRNDSAERGFAIYQPQDRGVCPWTTASMQQVNCPMSEPGPMAGMTRAAVWEDPGWRFHVLATWADVRAKAKRIRSEGGVSIVSALADGITGHVHGDTGVYESQINYVPGSFKVGYWQCGCAWASYAWGRSPAFRRFEGRMCSHALALQYEAQARGMFGRQVTEDTERPGWMRDKVRVRHDRSTREHDVRAASRQDTLDPEGVYPSDHGLDLARSPIHAFAIEAYATKGDPADVLRVFLAAGIEHGDARRLLDAALHERAVLDVQVQDLVDLGTGLELTAAKDEEPSEPTHAGVVLKAADTGRVLMIQRSNHDETDPAAGTWEFPGGGREEGDHTSLHSGIREFEEEVGHEFPTGGHVSHVWQSPNGVYQGHVVVIPEEKMIDFSGGRRTVNPDDPDGDDHEQSAWWDPDHARKNPALRPECKSSPWDKIKTATLHTADEETRKKKRKPQVPYAGWWGPGGWWLWDQHHEEHGTTDGEAGQDVGGAVDGGSEAALAEFRRRVADYAAHDWLEDVGNDPRPKPPPKAPEPGQPENPGSTGFATSQDPPEWENASQRSETMSMTMWSSLADPQTDAETMPYGYDDLSEFREDHRHGELRDEPEPALPSTTADDEDIVEDPGERYRSQMTPETDSTESLQPNDGRTASVSDAVARFQASAGAAALQSNERTTNVDIAEAARQHLAGQGGIQRTALKDFSATERHELITEGQGQLARNFGDLKIAGTHYEAIEAALAKEQSLDPDDLFD